MMMSKRFHGACGRHRLVYRIKKCVKAIYRDSIQVWWSIHRRIDVSLYVAIAIRRICILTWICGKIDIIRISRSGARAIEVRKIVITRVIEIGNHSSGDKNCYHDNQDSHETRLLIRWWWGSIGWWLCVWHISVRNNYIRNQFYCKEKTTSLVELGKQVLVRLYHS